ncbi:S-adenosyl-L-methionine-dependent methyltransferase [Syncephalastrum racemosum]|uniref:S-adenosyl-L-methionine-dependent methyltransferase n=1 Tax=Syncephalastrum racemosum TaxID=13706 RepID=A0A1X2HS84_SYNRA|nr:S-adenosyl-L-methionine-dependent methyltransferase [Syncephalastrum racemosum]
MLQSARQWIGSWFQGKRKHEDDEDHDADQNKRAKLEESNERVYCVRIANAENQKKFPRILRREGYHVLKNHPKGIIYVAARSEEDANKKATTLTESRPFLDVSVISRLADDEWDEMIDKTPPHERLANQVTPLHSVPYEEQLELKTNIHKTVLKEIREQMVAIGATETIHEGEHVCQVLDPLPAPNLEGYRSKCEFTIGYDLDNQPTVGFLLGLYKKGVTAVLEPSQCKHIPPVAKKIAKAMQDYVRQSKYPAYDRKTHQGVWRLLMTRTQRTGDAMVLIQLKSKDSMTAKELAAEKKHLVKYFQSFKDKPEEERFDFSTLILQDSDAVHNGFEPKAPTDVLVGDGYIHEELLGLKFRISASSFFQVNTEAAEVLYSKCAEWCNVGKKTTLLDVCCGTGTIGLTMASHVDKVAGIDMVPEAIEDAHLNAKLNGIENVEYFAGRVETKLDLFSRKDDEDVVAVLDPARAGVGAKVISAVRQAENINKVIYISCDAEKAKNNFFDLIRPAGGKIKGSPFRASRAVSVDLFPHTKHCELMIEFVRGEKDEDNSAKTGLNEEENVKEVVEDTTIEVQQETIETTGESVQVTETSIKVTKEAEA